MMTELIPGKVRWLKKAVELNEKELERAKTYWYLKLPEEPKNLDHRVTPYLAQDILPKNKKITWLKDVRKALHLSTSTVAQKMKVTRGTYSGYEASEKLGTITLNTLAQVAEAMDCELVYAIRPKKKVPFTEVIWTKILKPSLKHPWLKTCDQKRRGAALEAVIKWNTANPQIRKFLGWSQRKY